MKALVFVLVLANLLFFAYTEGYFGRPDDPDAGRVQQQIHPERIEVAARGEAPPARNPEKPVPAEKPAVAGDEAPPAADKPVAEKPAAEKPAAEKPAAEKAAATDKPAAAPEKPPVAAAKPEPQEACLAWGNLPAADASKLSSLLGEKFAEFRVERRVVQADGGTWWVFIPPLSSKADADRKTGELKRMGITDYFVIQEAGPNRFAVSLGVFSSEAGASEHLANLRSKGVRSAKMAPRPAKDAHYALEARGPATRRGVLAAAAAAALPGSQSESCK